MTSDGEKQFVIALAIVCLVLVVARYLPPVRLDDDTLLLLLVGQLRCR